MSDDSHDVFDAEPAEALSAGEPTTPMWLPVLGAALFAMAGLVLSMDDDATSTPNPSLVVPLKASTQAGVGAAPTGNAPPATVRPNVRVLKPGRKPGAPANTARPRAIRVGPGKNTGRPGAAK